MVRIKINSGFTIFNAHKKQMNEHFLIENVLIFESKVMVKIKNRKFIISNTQKKQMNGGFFN